MCVLDNFIIFLAFIFNFLLSCSNLIEFLSCSYESFGFIFSLLTTYIQSSGINQIWQEKYKKQIAVKSDTQIKQCVEVEKPLTWIQKLIKSIFKIK